MILSRKGTSPSLPRGAGRAKVLALAAVAALGVAACGSSGGNTGTNSSDRFNPTNFNPSWLSANVNNTGSPVKGGTLKIEGSTDVSAALDPQGEYETIGYAVERTFTRQLLAYPASTNLVTAETVVPDAAQSMPTVSSDGLTYTFHLRSGVMWNTTPPREVTSQDFARGIKRNCDPTLAPNGNPSYYEATIAGFKAFCEPFLAADPNESASARADYINNTQVSGISTPDSKTIVFTLTQPASDFNNIIAMPFASAAPAEVLNYVPLTPGNPLFSDGPYQVNNYNVGHELDLNHNPAWSQSSDPIRHQYVDAIQIKLDLSGSAASTEVQNDLQAGTTDLQWNTLVPTSQISSLESPQWNPGLGVFPAPGITNPYLVFNVQSPNNNGALGNVKVRQALEYAIDKVAINKIYGGAALNEPLNQVFAPGAQGYQAFNLYPTPSDQGDPQKCKQLLSAAGVTNLTLKDFYRDSGNHPAVFEEVKTDFAKCGVTVVGTPISTGYYGSSGIGVTSPDGLKAGKWDITSPGWVPDWFGPTNARSILPPLFSCSNFPGSNWGGFCDQKVDSLIKQALSAKDLSTASDLWHKADMQVMTDAAFIPYQTSLQPLFHSKRVHNAIYNAFSETYDYTQLWLSS